MKNKLLLVTTAISGNEACSNANTFMLEFEHLIDSYDLHGAISTESEIFIYSDSNNDNVFDSEIKSFSEMKSYSITIAKQYLNYEAMFEIVKRGEKDLEWITWYGASKYCILKAELSNQSLTNPEEFNLLEHELFPVDFSLHQIAHHHYNKENEKKWIVLIDVKP